MSSVLNYADIYIYSYVHNNIMYRTWNWTYINWPSLRELQDKNLFFALKTRNYFFIKGHPYYSL